MKSAECNDMAQNIWLWFMEREIRLSANGFEFLLTEHVKQSRPGYRAPVVLEAYPADLSPCVPTYLKEYLRRTKPLRGSESKLLLASPNLTNRSQEKLFPDGSIW